MVIFSTGFNYKTAPVEIREKLAITENNYGSILEKLNSIEDVYEICVISTCNRVELYGVSNDNVEKVKEEILRILSQYSTVPVSTLKDYLFFYTNKEAIRHIFRVSSSLDSMVIGEPQIVCQFKDSFTKAKEYKAVRHILTRLFDKALNVSKKIRTSTGISRRAVSISYAAVLLAKKIFGDLKDKNVLIIGAGEMAELAAKHLHSLNVKHIFVSNRTFEKAVELADKFSGSAIRFEKIQEFLPEADIIIVSTGAKEPILKKEDVKRAIKSRKDPLFIIDISVPRNVEESVNELEGVYLYNIDDLKQVVNSNLEERKMEAQRAEFIIDEEVEKFVKWLNTLKVSPIISSVRDYADKLRQQQLEKLFKQMPYLNEKERETIDLAMRSLINKLLHRPTMYIKDKAAKERNTEVVKIFEDMFSSKWDLRKKSKSLEEIEDIVREEQ
ncbi:glutamyl-tRNA reductase [Sulfurihydrogenibium yellowstonense]|uniref:Glutamyl-tRNA reductase n=1 Tax=Sulfurihydrogenibium yellowstonense SS-5 TaxID=432331 RepID=C4FLY1_9AQUI|nr:glutamyl-tRNA reductase [Sulfurihydrogenibium yellowstonense]EEP59920.1 glutamyl-tRNA reductase [Sulfurihydrogenibium yellowstonense SS-5]